MSSEAKIPKPKAIQKHSSTEMQIQWDDGVTSLIPFIELRYQCRCAECVDEWSRERKIRKGDIKPDIKPMSVDLVGRYAIQIRWSDGHSAGIYPFEQLHEIAHAKGAQQ